MAGQRAGRRLPLQDGMTARLKFSTANFAMDRVGIAAFGAAEGAGVMIDLANARKFGGDASG